MLADVAELHAHRHGVGPVVGAQGADEGGDVIVHGAGREAELARDVLGAQTVVEQAQDLGLALGEVAGLAVVLALVGAVGGGMVVPLNALLQHRGATLLSAGRSIAVQGFNENLSVLAMLAAYAVCEAAEVPIEVTLSGLGVLVAVLILALIWLERRPRCLA